MRKVFFCSTSTFHFRGKIPLNITDELKIFSLNEKFICHAGEFPHVTFGTN